MQVVYASDCPSLVSNSKTPKIYWYQTDKAVIIRIILSDVNKYNIKVKSTIFQFSTKVKDDTYCIGMKLCGTVVAEKTSHQNFGREIKVCLIKAHKWVNWPRLQLSMEKNQFISVDPEHIIKKSWINPYAKFEEKESFEEYKKRMNITNIPPPMSSSSDSDSDDEKCVGYD